MLRKLILLAMFFSFSFSVSAQETDATDKVVDTDKTNAIEETAKVTEEAEKKEDEEPEDFSYSNQGGSEKNRSESVIHLGITPIGISVDSITQPVSLGYIVNEDFMAAFEIGSFSYEDTDDTSTFALDYKNSGFYFRWFPGNSFNIKLGVYHRTFEGSYLVEETLSETYEGETYTYDAEAEATVTSTATVASLGIGNMWQFDWGMTLGVDWLVYNAVLSHDYSYTVTNNVGYTTAEAEDELAKGEDIFKQIHGLPGLLVVQVGFSF
ncbi:MAG: hypothetical protein QNL04_15705 [SAR324 cluster bacterium]|nr:hypothetical protein [SAR324 cluster bacterium]